MENRKKPILVAGRFDQPERRLIAAACQVTGETVSDLVRSAVLPAVRERLSQAVAGDDDGRSEGPG